MAGCTIVLRKQLASARVLASSFKRSHPSSGFFILILDGPTAETPSADGVELLGLENIDLEPGEAHRFPMLHDASALADLVRPSLLRTARRSGARLTIYFSPEIEIFARLDGLLQVAGENSIVLGSEASEELADDPGCNVGYWNLPERSFDWAGDHYEVNGKPLRFFNFRGYDPDKPHLLSKDQGATPRILLSEQPAVAKICDEYRAKLVGAGFNDLKRLPYRFDCLPSGLEIDPHMRRLYREALEAFQEGLAPEPPSPFGPGGEKAFIEWLNEPIGTQGPIVTRYMLAIHAAREDVRNAFPDPAGPDAAAFQSWYVNFGRPELKLPPPLVPFEIPSANGSAVPSPAVNVAGYFQAELGIGEAARLLVAGLEAAKIPFNTFTYEGTANRQTHPFVERKSNTDESDLSLICINADQLPAFAEKNGPSLLHGRYTIGVWFWEVEDFPESFHGAFNYVDEIWVASEFMQKTLLKVSPKPVFKFHLPILPPKIDASISRQDLGMPDRFLFLFVFDLLSVLERKNPLGLIEAFVRAFAPDEGPVLAIKTINGDKRILEMEKMRYAARHRPDIIVADGYLTEAQKSTLLAQADCYVSLHRSEGYGLSIAEVMALGKPVIATAYSGNLEFMTPENSYLCPARRCEVGEGREPYPADSHWSEPDLVEAAKLLRDVYTHANEARARGRRAAEDMRAFHSPELAGRVLRARIETIRKRRSRPALQLSPALLQERVEALEDENRALLHRLRENQSASAHS